GLLAHDRGDVALELEQHALLLLARDVASYAAVADELPGIVVDRVAAERQMAHVALRVDLAELEILEGLVRLADRTMRLPVGRQEVVLRDLPAAPAEHRARPAAEDGVDRIGQERNAVLRVGFPDQI